MQAAVLASFCRELEKIAVDATTLTQRTTGPGRVQNYTGRLTGATFGPMVMTGGAGTTPRLSQVAAYNKAPSVGQSPVVGKMQSPQVAAAARTHGGEAFIHPQINARMTSAQANHPMPSPAGVNAMAGVGAAHEIAERRVKPQNIVSGYHSHLSPDVLVQEHNTLSRLTGEGAEEARSVLRKVRTMTGEQQQLRNMFTTAFNDPRAANFLAEGEKVPKAMRKAFLRKIQSNPSLVSQAAPTVGLLDKVRAFPANIGARVRTLGGIGQLALQAKRGLL